MARLGEARRGRGGEGWPVGSGCKLGMGNAVLNIEWRHPDGLTSYARNPKTHPDDQIAKIAASIASFGFDQPIVVDAEGVIIKGHGRREASLLLGLTRVPVVVRNDLSVAQIGRRVSPTTRRRKARGTRNCSDWKSRRSWARTSI